MDTAPQQTSKTPIVAAAYDVPEPHAADLFKLSWHKLVAKRINALLHLQSVPSAANGQNGSNGPSNPVRSAIVSDGNVILPYVPGTGSGSAGGGVTPRGLYTTANNYNVNDMVYTSPATDTRFMWVCEIANGPDFAGIQQPTWPEPATVYWRCYARSGLANCPYG